jgi:hypothetical protein
MSIVAERESVVEAAYIMYTFGNNTDRVLRGLEIRHRGTALDASAFGDIERVLAYSSNKDKLAVVGFLTGYGAFDGESLVAAVRRGHVLTAHVHLWSFVWDPRVVQASNDATMLEMVTGMYRWQLAAATLQAACDASCD